MIQFIIIKTFKIKGIAWGGVGLLLMAPVKQKGVENVLESGHHGSVGKGT